MLRCRAVITSGPTTPARRLCRLSGGGRYPFGHEQYQVDAYWYLRLHPVYAKEVEQMALAIVSGKSGRPHRNRERGGRRVTRAA